MCSHLDGLTFDQVGLESLLTDVEPSFSLTRLATASLAGEDLDTYNLRGMDLFSQFHLSLRQLLRAGYERFTPEGVLESIKSYQEICSKQLGIFDNLKHNSFSLQDKSMRELQQLHQRLTQEHHTWKLIQFLHKELIYDENAKNMDTEEKSEILFTSEQRVVDNLLQNDSNVRRYNAVVQWLEDLAREDLETNPLKSKCLAKNICFENTLLELRDFRNKKRPLNPNLVTEMDPDAPLRQKKQLSELDQKDELMLSQCIWYQVRAGCIDEAEDILEKVGQPLKASNFEGGKFYHDPNYEVEPVDVADPAPIQGNMNRDIWKFIMLTMSEDTRFNVYERAIYGTLSGNLNTILPACKNWNDWLWACYKVMLDVYFECEIRNTPHNRRGKAPKELPSTYWQQNLEPEIIFTDIQASPNENIRRYANSNFGLIQFYLITNQLDELIDTMHGWVNGSEESISNPGIHLLRFIAHLVIYCRQVELAVDVEKCDAILDGYIRELIRLKEFDMVGIYTACLGNTDKQVSCYSNLLQSIPNTDSHKRCLNIAKEAGLNTNLIIRRMVETVKGEQNLWQYPLDIPKSDTLSEFDQRKIQVMDWLLYDQDQLPEALIQGLTLIRLFLSANKYVAASKIFIKLPRNILHLLLDRWKRAKGNVATPPEFENSIKEYLCFSAYFEAREAFDDWFTYFYQQRPHQPESQSQQSYLSQFMSEERMTEFNRDMEAWHETMEAYQLTAKEKIEKVLLFEGGWMLDRYDLGDEERKRQQGILRNVCIPSLCFLLYSLLKECGHYQNCLRIANLVASEDYKLYQLFTKEEFNKLLNLMQESSVLMSERKEIDFLGYPL